MEDSRERDGKEDLLRGGNGEGVDDGKRKSRQKEKERKKMGREWEWCRRDDGSRRGKNEDEKTLCHENIGACQVAP